MNSYFDKITKDYENAEVTSVIVHDRKSNGWFNLLTIIELIPAEQQSSALIGLSETNYMQRKTVDKDYSVYVARMINCVVKDAIEMFHTPQNGILLRHEAILNLTFQLFKEADLEQEPPSDHPLLISPTGEHSLAKVLPHRHTSFRVWNKIDRSKRWLDNFGEEQKDKLFKKAGELTLTHLGFDLSRLPEHAGNIYMCCCNPYIRKLGVSLLDLNKDLLIHFNERTGQTIIGKRLQLEDDRAGNLSFSIARTIASIHERVQLPHFPDLLYLKLYDSNGFLIENHTGTWINFSFQMQMQTTEINLTVKGNTGVKKLIIPKYSSEKPVKVGSYDHSLTHYFKSQQRNRDIEELQQKNEFIFFPGSPADKEKAREVVENLLNRSGSRCMMLDPYFGAGDVFYAYIIRNTSVPIRILTSAAYIKGKIVKGGKISYGDVLKRELNKYKKHFPNQAIECRVLLGGKSPLHDRYIVSDNSVYLLGSSFNELGSRATTLIKVPAPETMIQHAVRWWEDEKQTMELTLFLKSIKLYK